MKIGRAEIPHGNAVGARFFDVELGGNDGSAFKDCARLEGDFACFKEFQLFSKAENGPGEAAGPGAKGRVTLLGIWAAVTAVVRVENAFVRSASADIVSVATFAVIDGVFRGGLAVFGQSIE